MSANKTQRPAGDGPKAQSEGNDSTKDSTPWAVIVRGKRGGQITWRRFASRAGALAELRLLHGRGVKSAYVEGPQS
jgi:hypothetical protein